MSKIHLSLCIWPSVSFCVSVCLLSVCLSVYLVCLSVCLSVPLSLSVSLSLSLSLSLSPPLSLSLSLEIFCMYVSVHQSLFSCGTVSLSVWSLSVGGGEGQEKFKQYFSHVHNECFIQVRVKKATIEQFPTYGDLYQGLCSTTGEIPIAIYRTERRSGFNPEVDSLPIPVGWNNCW